VIGILLCNYPFTHFEINNPNGDVTFCCNHHLVLGNINNQSIEEIWNSEKYQEVRQKFLDGKIFDVCYKECPVLNGWKDYEKLDWYKELPKESPVYKNAELNEKEIKEGKIKLLSKPRWIRFATSYRCNLKCYHCFQSENRKQVDILPQKFFDELKEKYLEILQVIFFYGGEPLIEKQNLELLEYLSNKIFDLKVFIVSNGAIEFSDKLKNIFENLKFGVISISIDSINPKLYEELRYPAKWSKVKENIFYIADLLKKQGAEFHLGLTINKKNYFELLDYIKFACELNAIPLFQIAGNTFSSLEYREKYEIYTKKEFELLKKELEKVNEVIENDVKISEYTKRNINWLIKYSNEMLQYNRLLKRIIRFLKRKKKIYFQKIKDLI